jgi:hypothetical protein
MPQLLFYADTQDAQTILSWLNCENEIAFLTSTGPKQWRALRTVTGCGEGTYFLWHVPCGPLPFMVTETGVDEFGPWQSTIQQGFIENPWDGWIERSTIYSRHVFPPRYSGPNFGVTYSGVLRLNLNTHQRIGSETQFDPVVKREVETRAIRDENIIGLSSFYFPNSYGQAPNQTVNWWKRLQQWVSQEARLIAQYTAPETDDNGDIEEFDFWIFPSAYEAITGGREYEDKGWPLQCGYKEVQRLK